MNKDPNLQDGNGQNDPTVNPDVNGNEGATGGAPTNPPSPDYKEKFQASASEANRMREALIANGIDPKTGQPISQPAEPAVRNTLHIDSNISDADIAKEIPGFEFLSEEEKTNIRLAKSKGQQIEQLMDSVAKVLDRDRFNNDVAALSNNPEFAGLSGDPEFKQFAYLPENVNTPLEVLAGAYMYNKKPAPATGVANRPGLESATGGATAPVSPKITTEDIAHIRKNDPKRYMQMVANGEIRSALN